jgi:hypothetical protein
MWATPGGGGCRARARRRRRPSPRTGFFGFRFGGASISLGHGSHVVTFSYVGIDAARLFSCRVLDFSIPIWRSVSLSRGLGLFGTAKRRRHRFDIFPFSIFRKG